MDDVRRLALNADAVLHADGSVTEAVPSSHGAGILHLRNFTTASDPGTVAASLYEGGVRRLLLAGGLARATPFLERALIDHVHAYLPDVPPSGATRSGPPWPQVPPGFRITGADKLDGFVRLDACRDRRP